MLVSERQRWRSTRSLGGLCGSCQCAVCGETAQVPLGFLQIQPMTSFLGKPGSEKQLLSGSQTCHSAGGSCPRGAGEQMLFEESGNMMTRF